MKILHYSDNDLPPAIKWQIVSFLRVQWPEGFMGENKFRDWITQPKYHPEHFVLVENDLLIGYTGTVWKELEHAGNQFKMYGLSGVFTYPSFRKMGYGLQLIQEAKKYIETQDGDIVLFPSMVKGFYEQAGFKKMDIKILEGDPKNPKEYPENIFMLFLSDKGKAHQKDFETKQVYFGEDVW